jgi:Fe-S-cluster-containing dehydrogenase component
MTISRRDFLKLTAAGLGALALPIHPGQASAMAIRAEDSASMLYDSVKCVGCRACQTACKTRSKLPAEPDPTNLYEAPRDLSANTWTLIKLYQGENRSSFVKQQCMHCIAPACVSVCPVGALEKLPSGPVVYHGERCIGCRYCMAACPFGIPKSQWDKVLPLIQKCDFCADRQAEGKAPACGEACPTGALIYGSRKQMLETAHARLDSVSTYLPHVYGETEAGGTAMLYISDVHYKDIGFPELKEADLPAITWPYLKAVPALIAVMVTLSTGIYLRTHRGENGAKKKEA